MLALRLVCGLPLALALWAGACAAQTAPAYTLAVGSLGPTDVDLFVAEADGSGARVLVAGPTQDYNGAISPDAAWAYFTSERAGNADIWRIRLDGTGLEQLTSERSFDDQAAVSPDGRSLAFVSDRGGAAQIWIMDIATRSVRRLTQRALGDFRPAWSPDGQTIAFSSQRDALLAPPDHLTANEIFIVRADGSGLRRIGEGGAFAGSPAWSPDGKSLVYYESDLARALEIINPRGGGSTDIVAIDVATGARRILVQGGAQNVSPRWLPRGVVYTRLGPDPGLRFADDPAAATPGAFEAPAWSANGERMVFHRDLAPSFSPVRPRQSLDPDFALMRTGVFASYAPDGAQVVYVDGAGGSTSNTLMVMNADGTQRRQLYGAAAATLGPAWSPKGDWIAFGVGRHFQGVFGAPSPPPAARQTSDIAIIRPDGSGYRVVTTDGGASGFPSWSPDGRSLVFRALNDAGKGLRILEVASGDVRTLPSGPFTDTLPSWSPTGDAIAFTSDRSGDFEIYSIRPDGTGLKRLTDTPGNDAHGVWSPDGRWYAFSSARGGLKDEQVLHPRNPQPFGDIFVIRADGSDLRRLTNDQFEDGPMGWISRRNF